MSDVAAPLIIQSDYTVLVEVDNPDYADGRAVLMKCAELVKAPEHIHTYRLTSLSIWNMRAAGVDIETVLSDLNRLSRYPLPKNVVAGLRGFAERYGLLRLEYAPEGLVLAVLTAELAQLIARDDSLAFYLSEPLPPLPEKPGRWLVAPQQRGRLKLGLIKQGFPVEDLAGFSEGEPLSFSFRQVTAAGKAFGLRHYQTEAVDSFLAVGSRRGGAGVIVLPCGAGKTIVGMGCMAGLQTSTLILTTSVTAVYQWQQELLDKTTLTEDEVSVYAAGVKRIRPVTIATYQMMTWRNVKKGIMPHLALFDRRDWGLIIYDEVHLLPAPVFQITTSLQAKRRLGLTATLVREDGREDDVFALIGPRKSDVPWKDLEQQGWIAAAVCTEVRLPLGEERSAMYYSANARSRFRIASEEPDKLAVVKRLLARHHGEPTLIIGMYVDQVKAMAMALGIPSLTGKTPQRTRDVLFGDFKSGRLPVLAVSKVANFAVDLPDAAVAIQISGTFGSRQEEAQRLGRILRPKPGRNKAHFYTLVTRDTVEQDFALNRQLFLCEQGYEYAIEDIENPVDIRDTVRTEGRTE